MTEGAEKLKDCTACNAKGYHHCDCWPGECLCGDDYEPCEECGGDGFIDEDCMYDYEPVTNTHSEEQ